MKAVGLITEYNPMHNGHIYHLNESLKLTNADLAVVIMSGNFVQRGEPAIIDKYSRARAAINSGAGLVLELPVYYCLSSAENFADGSVQSLNAIGVNDIVFGSECGNIDILKEVACILANEPDIYKTLLKKYISCGYSFPAARQKAFSEYLQKNKDTEHHYNNFESVNIFSNSFPASNKDNVADILSNPNNILGIEYIKSIIKHKYDIVPHALKRIGNNYNDTSLSDFFSSASAIRQAISDKNNFNSISEQVKKQMPSSMYDELFNENPSTIFADDFSEIMRFKLLELLYCAGYDKTKASNLLTEYCDISPDIAMRIVKCFSGIENFTELILKIKTKQLTYSRISRCLMKIILNINNSLIPKYKNIPYIRILGFDERGQKYLSLIKKTCQVPIITKTADYSELLLEDINASSIYNQITLTKHRKIIKDEYHHGIYIKKGYQSI